MKDETVDQLKEFTETLDRMNKGDTTLTSTFSAMRQVSTRNRPHSKYSTSTISDLLALIRPYAMPSRNHSTPSKWSECLATRPPPIWPNSSVLWRKNSNWRNWHWINTKIQRYAECLTSCSPLPSNYPLFSADAIAVPAGEMRPLSDSRRKIVPGEQKQQRHDERIGASGRRFVRTNSKTWNRKENEINSTDFEPIRTVSKIFHAYF